ncbi:MAG: putative aminohydrolase SsnA [Anaerolineales bacterium]|nr:putative aminohydrolase SsnA [Anaerolineales bacterium]
MLITNGDLVTWENPNRILKNHAVRIEGDRIAKIGPSNELKAQAGEEVLDAGGQLVMPGNICAHTHFYGAFARGMGIPGAAPDAFPQILEKLWWPLDKSLTDEDVKYSALVCLVDAIKHGTTTLIDHHASPNAIEGSLDVIADTVYESGLRGVLCYEVTDRDGKEKAQAGIEENARFYRRCENEKVADGRVRSMFGMHASLTISNETLEQIVREAPDGAGFHIHVAEHEVDEYDSMQKYGKRVIDRLNEYGALGDHSIVVHGVHIDAREMAQLAETNTWVTHQPRSNMNNGVGVSEVEAMLRMGIKVGLGNDGFSNAMWEEWKAAYLVHKVWRRDPRRMSGTTVVDMAVYNNRELVKSFFPEACTGLITPGAFADLIFVNYHPTTPLTDGNLPWHMIFGFNESMITTTIASGKVLMKDHKLLVLDEAAITAKSRELAANAWKRYEKIVPGN